MEKFIFPLKRVISLERVILSGPLGDGLVMTGKKFQNQVGQMFVDFDPLVEAQWVGQVLLQGKQAPQQRLRACAKSLPGHREQTVGVASPWMTNQTNVTDVHASSGLLVVAGSVMEPVLLNWKSMLRSRGRDDVEGFSCCCPG